MKRISKASVNILAHLLSHYGVKRVVCSPGSRNAPILVALNRKSDIECISIIDERVAGFVALGMAMRNEPVALVCTSGSALLNYAPAVAEAYYQRVPLIIISADRPVEWIDQRDSQTIRQTNVLTAIVRKSVNVPDDISPILAQRLISDAIFAAIGAIPGPVHINMPLSRPLTEMTDEEFDLPSEPTECIYSTELDYNKGNIRQLFEQLNKSNVLILSGSKQRLSIPTEFNTADNLLVVAEYAANSDVIHFTPNDLAIPHDDLLKPDVVLNIGGAIISDRFKSWLRSYCPTIYSLGYDDTIVDTFRAGKLIQIQTNPERFFQEWSRTLPQSCKSDFRTRWLEFITSRYKHLNTIIQERIWCDLTAMHLLSKQWRSGGVLFIANGMVARYAQLVEWKHQEFIGANRGVSGIDGCTSTAAGLSLTTDKPTLYLSGDMGFAYDIGALALRGLNGNFYIVVFDNEGGDIFRRVATTSDIPEREELFTVAPKLPLRQLAAAYDFEYYEACNYEEMLEVCDDFMSNTKRPSILRIKTTPEDNTYIYNKLFNKQ